MAKLLVAAIVLPTGVPAGDIVENYESSYTWGSLEVLPNFLRVEITDKNKTQLDNFLERIVKAYTYSVDAQNAAGARCTMRVDEAFSGDLSENLDAEVRAYVLTGGEQELTVVQVSETETTLQVDIAVADDETRLPTLQAFKRDINDKFQQLIGYRRYAFTQAGIDFVLGHGGEWAGTANQADKYVFDKFTGLALQQARRRR